MFRKKPRDESETNDLALRQDGEAPAPVPAASEGKDKVRLHATLEGTAGPNKGQTFPLTRIITMIGRQEGCDIVLADQSVSREHGQFEQHQDEWVYTNLSENGSWVNRQKIDRIVLRSGDALEVGAETKLKFLLKAPEQLSVGPVIRRRARPTQAETAEEETEAPPPSTGQLISDSLRKRRKWVIGIGIYFLVCAIGAILFGLTSHHSGTGGPDEGPRFLTESDLRQYFDAAHLTPLARTPPDRNPATAARLIEEAYLSYQRKDVPHEDLALYTAVRKLEEAKAYLHGPLPTDDGNKAEKTLRAARTELQERIWGYYRDAQLAEVQNHHDEAMRYLDAIEKRIEPSNKQLWSIIVKQRARNGK